MINKKWYNSISYRKSNRTYKKDELDEDSIERLVKLISQINKESSLNIQFVKDCSELFDGFKSSYGLIKGVKSCIALVGSKNMKQYKNKIGYYGEMIVLEATSMGIGTCWIGGTYNKKECQKHINIKDDEELVCVISVGYSTSEENLLQRMVARVNKKRKEFDEILIEKDKEVPMWVMSGINSVIKAPSAVNKQPVGYTYKDNTISAYNTKKNHGYEEVDLGISMLHFELGAKNEGYEGIWKYTEKENKYIYSSI